MVTLFSLAISENELVGWIGAKWPLIVAVGYREEDIIFFIRPQIVNKMKKKIEKNRRVSRKIFFPRDDFQNPQRTYYYFRHRKWCRIALLF